jgi:hypothetical protein
LTKTRTLRKAKSAAPGKDKVRHRRKRSIEFQNEKRRALFGQRGSIEAGGAAEHGALAVAGERDGSGGGDARGLAFEQISGEAGRDEVARGYRL